MTTAIPSCSTSFIIFAAVVFSVISLAHFLRLTSRWTLQVGQWSVPRWASVVGALGGALGAIWGFSVLFTH
jgi:hypothetical protein